MMPPKAITEPVKRQPQKLTSNKASAQIIQENMDRYYIKQWGEGYFNINSKGHLCVCPEPEKGTSETSIDIMEVISDIQNEHLGFPVVIRFHDILRNKIKELNQTFHQVIAESNYQGSYRGVYPIKVNQMREVVEEVLDSGQEFHLGLEAGSKGELMAVLAMNQDPQALTILNGYKDYEFIKLAMIGRKLQRKIVIVVERYSELATIIEVAREMNTTPLIGFRIRPATSGSGKWKDTAGARAKFGPTATEILQGIEVLKQAGFLESVKLIHFHLGSQVTNIQNIKNALTEAVRFYTELHKLGVPLEYLNVGGGLGVDYDGSSSTNPSSKNYSLKSYVSDIVYTVQQICDLENTPHPTLISESGRFISAHHSCIVTKVLGAVSALSPSPPPIHHGKGHHLTHNMQEILEELGPHNLQESYNDSLYVQRDIDNGFQLGIISLKEKAASEQIFQKILQEIKAHLPSPAPAEFAKLIQASAAQYICNFSVFQSLPDTWAIKQLIPIVPISRLNETPENDCTLADITCDSDGKIDHFIAQGKACRTIKLHKLHDGEDYYIGFFLTGAYQDVMGDMHNLFGRLHEVHIYLDDDDPKDFYIEEIVRGSSTKEVLAAMQYNAKQLSGMLKKSVDKMVQKKQILPREGVKLSEFYQKCLYTSYTYLN